MSKCKQTKKALLSSVIALILCFSMLLGTTFAWFTDSVESGINKIYAGNLDIGVTHTNDKVTDEDIEGVKTLFSSVTLWEPGAVAYEKLTVTNLGSLALKYALSINFSNENTVNGYGLSQVLKVAVLSDEVLENLDLSDREAVLKAAKEANGSLLKNFTLSGKLLNKNDATEYCLVIYWEPGAADNNWNVQNGKVTSDRLPLHIDLGVKVVATQLMKEEDSFGNDYDKSAAWTGEAVTKWYTENPDADKYIITSAEELAGLAQLVNAGNTFAGKTIQLGADIDLNNLAWTPIGDGRDLGNNKIAQFGGSFIGYEKDETTGAVVTRYTIYNLNVSGTECVGLIGSAGNAAHIEGVSVVNATVSGNHWVGTVLGYGYLAENCLKNCYVEKATVTCTPVFKNGKYDDGDKAGIIAGLAINGNISGNEVKDSAIFACRDFGGIVGMAQSENRNITVSGNSVVGLTMTYINAYDLSIKNENMNSIVGRLNHLGYKVTVADDNTASDVNTENINGGIVINTAEELYAFAAAVNAGNTYKGKTVILGADIDLANMEWTPIGNSTYSFQGIFDGNGKTVSNLNVNMPGKSNVGLFGMTTEGEIKNLTVENAKVTGYLNVGVVAGTPYTSKYTNITVKGHVEVNGMSYVGGVGGKNAYANWTDVTVDVDETSYVKAISTEDGVAYRTYVGGVTGFNGEGGHTFKNITSNIDVIGDVCDIGGVFGMAHYNNKFENITCTGDVTNLISSSNDGDDAAIDVLETGLIAGVWHNQNGTTVEFTNVSATGNILTPNVVPKEDFHNEGLVGKKYSNSGTGELIIKNYFVEDGITYCDDILTGDVTLVSVPADAPAKLEIPTFVTALGNKVLNGNTTVKEVVVPASVKDFAGTPNETGTGASGGFFYGSAVEKVTLPEGLTEIPVAMFNQATKLTSVNIPTSVKKIGINAFAGSGLTSLTISENVEEIGYGAFRDMANLETITIEGDVHIPTYAFRACASLKHVYLNGINVTFGSNMIFTVTSTNNENPNGITVHVRNEEIKNRLVATGEFKGVVEYNQTANANGVYTDSNGDTYAYANDATTMSDAITNGAETVYLSAGDYVIPAAAQGKTLTIVGSGDTSVAVTKVGSGGENCDYGLDSSTVVFENVTITTNSSTYIGYARCKATFNNCTFNGTYTLYDDSTFNNCTFNVSGDVYNVWTWGAPNATFNGCTFNNDGKGILLYGTANTKLTVDGCTFNDNGGLPDLKAAIEIGNDYGKSYQLIVNKAVVNGYEINDKGINTGTTLWANKNSMGTDKLNVVIDGVDVY